MKAALSLAVSVLIFATSLAGCANSSSDNEQTTGQRAAARAALARKLNRLRTELHKQRALRAKRQREKSQKGHDQAPATAADQTSSISFERMAASLEGEVGAVIGAPGSAEATNFGNLTTGSAWSTSKVPIALRLLADVGGPSGLSSTQASEVRSALTLSDNEAAAAMFNELERRHGGLAGASNAVDEVLREGGDYSTTISTRGRGEFSTYGQTEWSLDDQQQFMSALAAECVVGSESSRYVLGLMGEVSSDTWGLGSAGLPARWKGGWGPGLDGHYLVRQMGILSVGGRDAVVTLAALPSDGQFASAQTMATRLAEWLASQAPRYAGASPGC